MTPTTLILLVALAYTIGVAFGLWVGYQHWHVPRNTEDERDKLINAPKPTPKAPRGTNVTPFRKKPKL